MSARTSLASRQAIVAVVLLFAYNGLVIGVYTSSIAILRDKIGIDAIHLAILFVLTGLVALGTMQVSGRAADKFGARRVCLLMILPLVIAAVGYALVPNYPLLLVTGVFLGMGNGGIDVAMNALGVQVEASRLDQGSRPIMSFFHGTWAIGCFLGSLGVSLVGTAIGLAPSRTLMAVALTAAGLGIVVWIAVAVIAPDTAPVTHTTATGQKAPIPRLAYLMGLMAIAFGLAEGTASDWSGTQVQQVAGVDPRLATWAVTVMMACMVAIRLCGDLLVGVIGRRNLVRFGGIVAAIGYLSVAYVGSFPLLLVGWALVGLGSGVIAPQVYASAGHLGGGRGLSVVVSFGYATSLMGPAIIGTLVHLIGIHHAMALPGVLLLGLIPLAGIAIQNQKSGRVTAENTADSQQV